MSKLLLSAGAVMGLVLTGAVSAQAQVPGPYIARPGCCGTPVYPTPVVYTAPAVYPAPVVYPAPAVYPAPVYPAPVVRPYPVVRARPHRPHFSLGIFTPGLVFGFNR